MKHYRNIALALVCILLGIMLSLQYKSVNFNSKNASLQNKRLEDLKDDIIREKRNNDDLKNRSRELEVQNKEYENSRGKIDETTEIIKKELERARVIAGLTYVTGDGIIVKLQDSDVGYVDDTNILDLLNEMRASGAQAISVNDERIIGMSEVRSAGRYIMINGKQMLAPFEIKVIADTEKIERSLKIIGGVVEKLEAYQIRVTIEKADNITIPKISDDGSTIKTDLLTPVK